MLNKIMRSKLFRILIIWLFTNAIAYGQTSHEVHLGFSSLRSWAINAPDSKGQILNYHFSPLIGYDLHVFDDMFALGVRMGPIYEIGNTVTEYEQFLETRREARNAYFFEGRIAYNFLSLSNSYFQIAGGLRHGQVYYYRLNRVRERSNSTGVFDFESNNRPSPNIDYLFSLAYQFDITRNKMFSNHHLAVRLALEMMYMSPREGARITPENKFSSIAVGPSVSLVWCINGSQRGLF